ncbi:SRPBCC domain-containing protein [Candidatus Gracilibacteria bacterium]|nr:SRPBCC domain-containing protein [Candidatus Gracilibacteria bacterium]
MNNATFTNTRILPFPKEKVLRAWTTSELLAAWWGPAGFSNEFEICNIVPLGDWVFTMIAPDGTRYANVSKWLEVEDTHILLEHVVAPHFFLRADFEDLSESTKITWTMTFDTIEILESLKPIIAPANEENLDRLESVLEKI